MHFKSEVKTDMLRSWARKKTSLFSVGVCTEYFFPLTIYFLEGFS